jgi:uncharacterized protein YwqG
MKSIRKRKHTQTRKDKSVLLREKNNARSVCTLRFVRIWRERMAKGKKTDNETIYKIMISMFSTNNFNETSRQLNIPVKTVEKIYKENKDKEEFTKLCIQKKEEFTETATRIINKATNLMEQRIDLATEHENELEEIIDEIWMTDKKEMNETKKKALVAKIAGMQLYSLKELAVAIGTMYDKRALAKGESTSNTDINIKMDKKVEELSQ